MTMRTDHGTWAPGHSGNPQGRPPAERTLAKLLRTALAKKGEDGITFRQKVVEALIGQAAAGDLDAIRVVFDRIDGKVAESLQVSGPDGAAIPLQMKGDFDYVTFDLLFGRLAARLGAGSEHPGTDDLGQSLDRAHPDTTPGVLSGASQS